MENIIVSKTNGSIKDSGKMESEKELASSGTLIKT